MDKMKPLKLTLEDGRMALAVHLLEKGYKLRKKYGDAIDYDTLLRILEDEEFVRYPVRLAFDAARIEKGLFAVTEKIATDAFEGYIVYLHPYFEHRLDSVPPLVLYHLVTVNYGEFASYNEAEEFGSAALGMNKEDYYQLLCHLTDQIEPRFND